jgi:hypothetical protein
MATSPNCSVPPIRQENRHAKPSVLDLVSSYADANATNGAGYETAGNIRYLLFKLGVEPTLTVQEAAAILRWSYWKARRYFSHIDGICVSYRPKRYKRPYRTFTIPVSVFAREWQKMTGHEPEAAHVLRDRLALAIQK